MTYKEAKKHIDDNWSKVNPYTSNPNSATPHQIIALIVPLYGYISSPTFEDKKD